MHCTHVRSGVNTQGAPRHAPLLYIFIVGHTVNRMPFPMGWSIQPHESVSSPCESRCRNCSRKKQEPVGGSGDIQHISTLKRESYRRDTVTTAVPTFPSPAPKNKRNVSFWFGMGDAELAKMTFFRSPLYVPGVSAHISMEDSSFHTTQNKQPMGSRENKNEFSQLQNRSSSRLAMYGWAHTSPDV